jgi:predicted negative regulator of RcsB-dependent stress response
MKQSVVSAVAVLFCAVIIAIVGLFGYSRYKASQRANEAFQAELLHPQDKSQGGLNAQMPAQLPARAGSAAGGATP